MYSREPLHMDEQRQDDQLEPINNSYVLIQDVAWKTYRERLMIGMGGERVSGESMIAGWHGNDDIYIYIYIELPFLSEGFKKMCKVYSVWVSLFNGISNFVGYLMPKPTVQKNSSCTIQFIARGIRGFMPFPKSISLKVYVIARLEFEHATMSQFSTIATTPRGHPPQKSGVIKWNSIS